MAEKTSISLEGNFDVILGARHGYRLSAVRYPQLGFLRFFSVCEVLPQPGQYESEVGNDNIAWSLTGLPSSSSASFRRTSECAFSICICTSSFKSCGKN